MHSTLTRLSALVFAGAALTSAAQAALLVNVDFDADYNSNTALAGQSGAGDIGFSGSFSGNNGSQPVKVQSGAIGNIPSTNYTVGGGNAVPNAGQYALLEDWQKTGSLAFTRNLSSAIGGQTLYARIVLVSAVDFNPDAYMLFALDSDNNFNGNELSVGVASNGAGSAVAAAAANDNFAKVAGGTLSSGVAHLVVARFNYSEGGYTGVDVWLNPSAGSLGTPDASAALTSFSSSFTNIAFVALNTSSDFYYGLDSLAVGTTWNDVVPSSSPIPEPASFASLAGVLAIGGAALRRRRA